MSVCSRSSSINSNKRRIDEIDDTIEYLSNEVDKCDDFALKSELESAILTLKLKREKVKALAAAARTQVLLADMEVLIAENDLLSDVEHLKKITRNKVDGGKDEPQVNQQELHQINTKSIAVQTDYRSEHQRMKRKYSDRRLSPNHSGTETTQLQSVSESPATVKNSNASDKNTLPELMKFLQALSQRRLKSTAVQTPIDDKNEPEHKRRKYNDSRLSPKQSESGTIQSESVSKTYTSENICDTSHKDNLAEPIKLTGTNQQENTQITLESTATQSSTLYRDEHDHDYKNCKPSSTRCSPMQIDSDTTLSLSICESLATEKDSNTSRKDSQTEPLKLSQASQQECTQINLDSTGATQTSSAYRDEQECKNLKPNDPRRTQSQSMSKSPITRKNSIEPLKLITKYELDTSLSSSIKAEFTKPYTTVPSQDTANAHTDSSKKHTGTPTTQQRKGKKERKQKNKKKPQYPVVPTKSTGTLSPKTRDHNILTSYLSRSLMPTIYNKGYNSYQT